MRIGLAARYAFRSQRRGIGQYVSELLLGLAQMQASDTFVLYVDAQADLTAIQVPDGRFELRQLSASNPLLFEEVALPLAARRDRLNLLHLTANYGPSCPPCPTLYTVHDLIEFLRDEIAPWQIDWRHHYGRAVRTRTLPRQARMSCGVIVPSQATKRDVCSVFRMKESRVWTVPFGSPHLAPKGRAAVRNRLRERGYNVPDEYLFAFSALDPRKNWRLAVDAFASVAPDVPDAELWLVGMEDTHAYPLNYPPWLKALGYLSREDALDLLQGATAFVYPSLYEGFGFPLLEAMSMGVPVIASDSTSIPELVGDAGILVQTSHYGSLAVAMRRVLLDRDLRDEYVRRGLARASQFRWEDTVKTHVEIYHRVGGAG